MQAPTHKTTDTLLALDVGERRIGIATASFETRLPRPLTTLIHDDTIFERLAVLAVEQQASALVVGLPRGLDGQHTAQTTYVEQFAAELQKHITLPLEWQDEALTSRQAEAELIRRGKPYAKGDIDALSATYILDDFLHRPEPETTA
ncbi:MAG TPA: Holliday junction resolvase RuvX [Candidatus Saccharimonadales bacterium]|nr:Holliday junction resolvase RuvX [Candidatus Saccharimonadales bacterium]